MNRILLVEDDKSIVMGLAYSLEQEGFEMQVCYDKTTALQALEKESFDLLLLDLSLPDGSGYDVCAWAKQKSDTPVIFLTVCDDEINVVMGLDMGADDYVTKPFRIRELISRIKSVLRRYGKNADAKVIFAIGNVRVDTTRGKVYKNDHEVLLTALEYRLLLALLNNEGLLMTRNQLLECIWDVAGDYVSDNTLTVYIKRLREKIEDEPQNPSFIKTVRGLGYKVGD